MKQAIISLLVGVVFGLGLCVSRMVDPQVVIGFLDVTGQWDPRLLLVMCGALLVNFFAYPFIITNRKPFCSAKMDLPSSTQIDRKLVFGAVLFGVGWGLVGICPGPAITVLAYGVRETFLFLGAMLTGMFIFQIYSQRSC